MIKNFFKISLYLLLILPILLNTARASRILFYIGGTSTYSHRSSIQSLGDRLASKGHQVTFIAPMAMATKHPAIVDIRPHSLVETYDQFLSHFGADYLRQRMEKRILSKEAVGHLQWLFDLGQSSCSSLLIDNPQFDLWLKKNYKKFDLLIIDSTINECAFGLAHFFSARTIMYSSMGVIWPWHVGLFQLPPELSWFPGLVRISQGDEEDLTVFDRLTNAVVIFSMTMFYKYYHLPQIDQILKSGLGVRGQNLPSVSELMRNTSLIFVNQHYSDQYPRPLPPFVVPVGGIHVDFEANGTLPEKIENFIMKERKGADFIFISLGTLVKVSALPSQFVQQALKAIENSPQLTFLWKWEEEVPQNAPKNVYFDPWFDQQQVLTHPKIRAFVTQGGQVSIQQGICHAVPLIVVPMAAEQDFNADRIKRMGHAISLDMAEFSQEKFEKALKALLGETRYATKAKQMAKACKDKPVTSLDTAVWYTEFVLRSDEATLDLLKPQSVHQSMWTYWCGDIWIFVFTALCLILVGGLVVVWLILYKIIYKRLWLHSNNNKMIGMKAKKS